MRQKLNLLNVPRHPGKAQRQTNRPAEDQDQDENARTVQSHLVGAIARDNLDLRSVRLTRQLFSDPRTRFDQT